MNIYIWENTGWLRLSNHTLIECTLIFHNSVRHDIVHEGWLVEVLLKLFLWGSHVGEQWYLKKGKSFVVSCVLATQHQLGLEEFWMNT